MKTNNLLLMKFKTLHTYYVFFGIKCIICQHFSSSIMYLKMRNWTNGWYVSNTLYLLFKMNRTLVQTHLSTLSQNLYCVWLCEILALAVMATHAQLGCSRSYTQQTIECNIKCMLWENENCKRQIYNKYCPLYTISASIFILNLPQNHTNWGQTSHVNHIFNLWLSITSPCYILGYL